MDKKCFTPISCELHQRCHLAHVDFRNGYFGPTNVGEHCHHFTPRVLDEDDMGKKLARRKGDNQ